MLVIRQSQLALFEENEQVRYERRLLEYLSREYPGEAARVGVQGLFDLIHRARKAGLEYNIVTVGAVAVWVELWLVFGDGLRRSADRSWAENILTHPVLPDYVRVEQVRERLTRHTGGRPVVDAAMLEEAA